MILKYQQPPNVRVINFSDIDLPFKYVLTLKSDNADAMLAEIRKYADLPPIYIVSKKRAARIPELLSALEAMRSPCYPYAIFTIDDVDLGGCAPDLAIFRLESKDPQAIISRVNDFASSRFTFSTEELSFHNSNPIPDQVDVVIVGAGISGLYAAKRLKEAGITFCILEKRDIVGGVWSNFANSASQVNSSEGAYRLFDKKPRSNRDHSFTREILEDIAQLTKDVAACLFLGTDALQVNKDGSHYTIKLDHRGKEFVIKSRGIILAINDRVGVPNEIKWENQTAFQGDIVRGFSDETRDIDWRGKKVVVVGMGAFAIENVRTALEAGARHVTVVCRRHGTVCPKIIDYLNFVTPYDDAFMHDNKSNIRNMMYWKKVYQLSGATQPECWMGKIKHEGHTISVSDIWFIGHFLKKVQTVTGNITSLTESGVVVNGQKNIDADIIVNCIGFKRNAPQIAALSGYREMYNNNFVDKNYMYLADAYIDDDAFNSLFGSSVLEMVKFYMEVFVKFFENDGYDNMEKIEGIEKIPIENRKCSNYIKAAMALIHKYPDIRAMAYKQVSDRTKNFIEIHDLGTYIAENKREWIDMHSMLAGRLMKGAECLPYVFEKLLPKKS